jgi:CRP-like cAMP-binding protein
MRGGTQVERAAAFPDKRWSQAEVGIFCGLSPPEMEAIAAGTPMKTYVAGELLFSAHSPVEALFILQRGRVRIFRVSADGRALTTAIMTPGTIFGEAVLLGQGVYGNFAQALDEIVVCVVNRSDVRRFLLSDTRIAARITAILGQRLIDMERRLSDTVFKSVRQRIAATLATLAGQERWYVVGSGAPVVALTHEQIAALVGTSRENATKILGDFADRGLIRLGRGRITLLDVVQIVAEAGD